MHHPTDRKAHTTAFVTPVMEHWLEREIVQWVHPRKELMRHRSRMSPRKHACIIRSEMELHDRAFAQDEIVNPLSYFSFQPVLHDWYNKGHGMCHYVYRMVHIKDYQLAERDYLYTLLTHRIIHITASVTPLVNTARDRSYDLRHFEHTLLSLCYVTSR